MNDDLQHDAGLLQDFLIECGELLLQLDQDVVALEAETAGSEFLNRAFRAFHTIKGTSGFMGFTQVVALTHHAEDVLNLLRKGERKITRRTIDILLAVVDQLHKMFEDIAANRPQIYATEGLLADLAELQKAQGTPPRMEPPRIGEILVVEQIVTPAELDQSLRESAATGKRVGEVLVDRQLASPGQIKDALARQASLASGRESSRTIRVDVGKLDELVNLVGELVLERNRIVHLSRSMAERKLSAETFQSALSLSATRLGHITDELRQTGMRTRMVPVDMVFRRLPRLVRALASSLGKEVELRINGAETEIDKTVVEEIADPLVHLVRNSLDHGIEAPAIRAGKGKPAKGTLSVSARQEGDNVFIKISDDGAGIDPERIGRKAVERGLIPAERLHTMGRRDILELIFLPGFSTAETVSDVSGRGVGMDVVRTNLMKLSGTVQIDSELGRGSCITLRLPLTLAVLPVLLVRVDRDTYALPLRAVIETKRISAQEVCGRNGAQMLRLRDRVLPLLRLRTLLHGESDDAKVPASLRVVVVALGETRVGLVVDQLLGQEETVMKPMNAYLRSVPGLAGATIGGDGQVRLILDPAGVLAMADQMQARVH